jgi:hypothetical protein
MRHPCLTVPLVVAGLVVLTGCSTSQVFDLVLVVRNKADGRPLQGVTASLDTLGRQQEGEEFPVVGSTDSEGRLVHELGVSPYPPYEGRRWMLRVRKDGFVTVEQDIRPDPLPSRERDVKFPLPVTVEMQPARGPR